MKNITALRVSILNLFLAICIMSCAGEIVSIAYALNVSESIGEISTLLTLFMIGGIIASPISIYLLENISIKFIFNFSYLISGLTVFLGSIIETKVFIYYTSFILGLTFSVFWSSLSATIPKIFPQNQLINVNKYTQSIRNLGYIIAPAIAGTIMDYLTLKFLCIGIGILFLIGAVFFNLGLKNFLSNELLVKKEIKLHKQNGPIVVNFTTFLLNFFKIKGIKETMLPLIVTICTTSTFNVSFMYIALNSLNFSKIHYGYLSGLISLGLVLGPLFLTNYSKQPENYKACIASIFIGLSVLLSGCFENFIFLALVMFILGVANGLQNTFMWTFVMKVIPKDNRDELMPIYVLLVQIAVLVGFFISGIINVQFAKFMLILFGAIAISFGILGSFLNKKNLVSLHD